LLLDKKRALPTQCARTLALRKIIVFDEEMTLLR
jgi:hypothetical protein